MSNLLKSKFLLGVMTIAVMFVGVVALGANTARADCSITHTLRMGSKGDEVKCLQTALGGLTVDGSFGAKTKSAVMVFQSHEGLTADGVFGPKSNAAWVANQLTGNFPAGCNSAVGYSSTTGQACYNIPPSYPYPAGCSSAAGFSSTTGLSCAFPTAPQTYPAGCTSTAGFSPVNGVACNTPVPQMTFPAGCTSSAGFSSTTGASCATGAVNNQTGPLTASLSSDNPAAGYIVAGQATADLLHVTFTGVGTISTVVLQRTGVSDQSTLSNVYLFNGTTRLTDGFSFNNVGTLTMNGLGIAVNGSLALSVKGDVSGTVTNASSLGITLTSFTAAGNTPTTVNVRGNDMTVATGAGLLGTAVFQINTVATSATSVNPGVVSYPLWSAPLNISTRSLWLKGANFRLIGSAPTDALANVTLFKDGVALANVATVNTVSGTTYLTFDFSGAPVELTTGSHTLEVRADIIKGSARNVQLSLQQSADLTIFDQQIGVNVAATGIPNTTLFPISINQGSVTVSLDPTFQILTKVTGGSTNATIAKFKVRAYGEDVKVDTLSILPVLSGCTPACAGLQNVTVYFNGSQVGSQTSSWTAGNIILTPGAQMIIPAGVDSSIEIRADLRTTGSVNYTGGLVSGNIVTGLGEGMSSKNTFNINGVTGHVLTIQTGLLAVGQNTGYLSQVMNSNTANVKIGSFALQNQSTSESVRVTSLRVTTTFAGPTYLSGTVTAGSQAINIGGSASTVGFAVNDVITIPGATPAIGTVTVINSATQLQVNITTGGVTPTVGGAITVAGKTTSSLTNLTNLRTSETSGNGSTPVGNPTGIDTFQTDFTLAPGATKTIDIMADLGGASIGNIHTALAAQGIGLNSNVQVFANGFAVLTDVQGQTITLATGAITTPTLTNASTASQFVPAAVTGASNVTKGTYKFTASNGVATITELKFNIIGSVANTATSVSIGGQTGAVIGTTVDITGLNLTVPNGGNGATFDAFVSYGPVGTSGTPSQSTSQLSLTDVIFNIGGQPGQLTGLNVLAPTMMLVGSKPVLTITTTSNAGLVVGENRLMDVSVQADSHGDVSLNTLVFNTAASGTVTIAALAPRLSDNGSTTITTATCTPVGTTPAVTTCTFAGGYIVQAGTTKVFTLFGTTGGSLGAAGTSSVTTTLGASSTLSWNDDAGAAATGFPITGATNTTYMFAYPTQTWSIHN